MPHKPKKPDPFVTALAELEASIAAADLDVALQSAVRAVLPGRQTAKNIAGAMHEARKAFVRTLRRHARAKAKKANARARERGPVNASMYREATWEEVGA